MNTKTCKKGLHTYSSDIGQCPECKSIGFSLWYQRNRETQMEKSRLYNEQNKEKQREVKKIYRKLNKEKIQKQKNNYYQKNKATINEKSRKYQADRRNNDRFYKLKKNIRTLIGMCYRNKGYSKTSKSVAILGCDYPTLQAHLEASFVERYGILPEPWMELHIDHIIPVRTATTEQELLELNNFTNLQLLFSEDNLSKSGQLNWGEAS